MYCLHLQDEVGEGDSDENVHDVAEEVDTPTNSMKANCGAAANNIDNITEELDAFLFEEHGDQDLDVQKRGVNLSRRTVIRGRSSKPVSAISCSRTAPCNITEAEAGTGPCSNALSHNAGKFYNWQATKTTCRDRLAFLFNNEILSDIHFMVGSPQPQRIPAHKFVLSVGSAVFDAMFNGPMSDETPVEIALPDIEPAALLALLQFLYSDEVHIGPDTVMTTLYTAKKYAVPALEQHCVDFLKKNLSSDNAFMLLTQARLFDEPQLAALCLETIDKNTTEALNAEGFSEIDIDTLIAVLERDTLRIREAKLFAAIVHWSEAECMRRQLPVTPENQRVTLGRALNLIRFPLMTVEEFASSAAQSGILTDREVVGLFLHFTVNPKPAGK